MGFGFWQQMHRGLCRVREQRELQTKRWGDRASRGLTEVGPSESAACIQNSAGGGPRSETIAGLKKSHQVWAKGGGGNQGGPPRAHRWQALPELLAFYQEQQRAWWCVVRALDHDHAYQLQPRKPLGFCSVCRQYRLQPQLWRSAGNGDGHRQRHATPSRQRGATQRPQGESWHV